MRRPNLKVLTHALATRIALRGPARRGVEYQPRRADSTRARAASELILSGGPDQFAAVAEALGRRAGGGTARARHRGGARPAGCRRESAGSPGVLFPGRLQGADHAVLIDQSVEPRAHRRALAAAQGRSRAPPIISRPADSSAAAPASRIPTFSITSCPWRWPTTARRWRRSMAFRRTSARCAPRAAAGCVSPPPIRSTSRAFCSTT